jgi:hypothetical protein
MPSRVPSGTQTHASGTLGFSASSLDRSDRCAPGRHRMPPLLDRLADSTVCTLPTLNCSCRLARQNRFAPVDRTHAAAHYHAHAVPEQPFHPPSRPGLVHSMAQNT